MASTAIENGDMTNLSMDIGFGKKGSKTSVPTTDDAQVSLILPEGAFASAEGQRSVVVTIDPVAPSTVSPANPPLHILGNVYELRAEYVPSGKKAPLRVLSTVVLVYPRLANDHGSHTVLWSRTGDSWRTVQTDDLPSIQQVSLGYQRQLGRCAPRVETVRAAACSPGQPVAGRRRGRQRFSVRPAAGLGGLAGEAGVVFHQLQADVHGRRQVALGVGPVNIADCIEPGFVGSIVRMDIYLGTHLRVAIAAVFGRTSAAMAA